jgi:hypothetical protein
MKLHIIILILCTLIGVFPSSVAAQEKQEKKGTTSKTEQEALERAKQQEAEKAKVATTPRKPRGRELNVQVELTITDTQGASKPETKVVSMLTADATMGRIRSMSGPMSALLNVDATPTVLENDRIQVQLTVEYGPAAPAQGSQKPSTLHESLSVILQNGKPLVISHAADPVSDRKMTVEIKATVLK